MSADAAAPLPFAARARGTGLPVAIRATPWSVYLLFAVLGAVLRVPLACYNYAAGYLEGNTTLINVDGIGYVRKAAGVQESFGDLNWLYEGMNSAMFRLGGGEQWLYLQMSLVNVLLAVALPLAAWPAFRALVPADGQRDRARLIAIVTLTLWPTSIWISTQNMKDTALALLLCAFTSAAVVVLQRGSRAYGALAALGVNTWLILSLRVYAAGILGLAFAVTLVIQWRRFPGLLVLGALVATGAALGPLRGTIETVLRPENRYFFDPEVVNAINEQRLGQSEDFLQINSTLPAIARDALRAPLNPYPSLRWHNAYDGLLMLRTVLVALALGGFLVWLVQWQSPARPFFITALLLSWLFFAIGRSYSGPRQVYSTIEPVMLIAGAVALSEAGRRRFWIRSAVAGTLGLLLLLVYTSLQDYAAAAQAMG